MEPNSARIIADIKELQTVCQLIVKAEGGVLSEEGLRSGQRQMSHNGGRVLIHKVRDRQRKTLLIQGSIHPDAEDALKELLDGPMEELAPDELEEALVMEQEPLDAIPMVAQEEEDEINEDFEKEDDMGV
jgi:hypothetical protein